MKARLFASRRNQGGQKDDIYGVKTTDRLTESLENGPGSRIHHSSGYHKFFEGWTEVRTLNEKGRVKIERYYTAPWMVRTQTAAKQAGCRAIYAALTVLAAVLYFAALSREVGSNHSPYVALPGMLTLVPMLLAAFRVATSVVSGRRLTKYEYETCHSSMPLLALAAAVGTGITWLATLIFAILHTEEALAEMPSILLLIVCAGCWLFIAGLEHRSEYAEEENDTVLPEKNERTEMYPIG